jgi:hypothetical protein
MSNSTTHTYFIKKGFFCKAEVAGESKRNGQSQSEEQFLIQIISLEKRIESLHITRSMQDRAEQLSEEAIEVIHHMDKVARLSNLAIRLYSYYIKTWPHSNIEDEQRIKDFMAQHLPTDAWELTGFYEKLYLYQSLCWYAFIRQDFLMYYRYAQKWVNLFEEQPLMKRVETGHYIKGLTT